MKHPSVALATPMSQLACRILLVEDDEDHQPLLKLILCKSGSEVTVAENGQEAIELAHAARDAGRPFDMILMDVQMPVLDGFAATRTLRAAGFDQPIIALTARAISIDRDKCLAAGCDDFIPKNVTRKELIRRLAGHYKRFAARRSASQN